MGNNKKKTCRVYRNGCGNNIPEIKINTQDILNLMWNVEDFLYNAYV